MKEADPARSRDKVEGARPTPSPTAPVGGADAEGTPDDVPFAPEADWVREQRSSLQYAGVGIQFGLTIALFALLGRWLDARFETSPWLLFLGVLLGFGGGTYSLLKKVSSGAA
jgi:hypothetical protein